MAENNNRNSLYQPQNEIAGRPDAPNAKNNDD